ncbi:hypothetical protein Tco_0660517 [Tanacetum coccineum]
MLTYGPKQSKTSESDTQTSNYDSCLPDALTLSDMGQTVMMKCIQPSKEQEIPSFASIDTVKHVKTPRETVKEQNTHSPSPKANKRDWNGLIEKNAKQVESNKKKGKGTGKGENRPVWNNVQRLNHQNKFVPTAVLTRTGRIPVNTASHNFNSQAVSTSVARKVNAGRKNAKPEPTLDAFDDLDADGRDYMETKDVVKEGRQSNETEELNKGSSEKGGSTKELVSTVEPKTVSTARPKLSTTRPNVDAARQEDSAVEPRTSPTTTSIFDDKDITMAQTLIKMKEKKAKEKGVSKDARSVLIAFMIARDAKIARQLQVDLQAEVERERQREEEASKAAIAETL